MVGQAAVEWAAGREGRDDSGGRFGAVQLPPLLLVAVGFALGIAVGFMQPSSSPWPWLTTTATLLFVGALAPRRAPTTLCVIILMIAAALLGAAWVTIRMERLHPEDLAGWIGQESQLVHVEAVALGRSETRQRSGGSMAEFDYRGPSTVAPIRIDALRTHDGRQISVRGRAYLRIAETCPPFRAGDRIRATGYLVPFGPPHNPGEFDLQQYARALQQAGMLTVPYRELISIEPAERIGIVEWWLRLRETLHRRAGGWLMAQLPDAETAHRDVLLRALLLGQREPEFDEVGDPFKRLGIAHLLAISGLHLGILAAMALAALRAIGFSLRWQAAAVAAIVLIYLLIVETRLPVMRAGIMTFVACLGLMAGRRWSVGGLVALSGIGLLIWRPDQLFSAGFQLSFGVVLGLIYLSPALHERLWPRPSDQAQIHSTAQMLGEWCKAAVTVSITSWLIAMPIIMYHFGVIAPLGIVLSVPSVPLVSALLALGYVKIVMAIDSLPGTVLHTPFPTPTWTIAAIGFVVLFIFWRGESLMRWSMASIAAIGLTLSLLWPSMPWHDRPALRLDVLSVGHGSCYVLQSNGRTFIFDAGSITSLEIGRRTVIPALRRIGVRSIDAIAISHPHMDHYAAVIELVDEFNVDDVLVTHQFLEHAREHPETPVAHVLDELTKRQVVARPMIRGERWAFGDAELQWLHPPLNLEEFGRDNEHSMVIRVDVADRTIVLTGDVERQGLAKLVDRQRDLRACVVELPHHGSFNPLAEAFVTQLEPEIVFQSSSRAQWRRDRWHEVLDGIERLVTTRDGALTITIEADGTIHKKRFLEPQTAE